MRKLMAILLIGSFASMTSCKCGKDNEEVSPAETLEMPDDSQHQQMDQHPEGDQMGQDMPEQPVDEGAPIDNMNEAPPEGGGESPE